MKKIKNFFKKAWKYIVFFFAGISVAIGATIAILSTKNNKMDKNKQKVIDDNKMLIDEAKMEEDKHEKDIADSNNNYNKLISGNK